jgi:heme A synthase
MTDFLISAHSGWQYVVLVGLVVSLFYAFRGTEMTSAAETTYRVTTVLVDIQVALGVGVWIASSGWSGEFVQAWVHPVAGLAALGVLHAFIGRARKADRETANTIVRNGLIIVLILVVAAIGIGESF